MFPLKKCVLSTELHDLLENAAGTSEQFASKGDVRLIKVSVNCDYTVPVMLKMFNLKVYAK